MKYISLSPFNFNFNFIFNYSAATSIAYVAPCLDITIFGDVEKNPGPPKRPRQNITRNRQNNAAAVTQIQQAAQNYPATKTYIALADKKYTTMAAVGRANRWIQANSARIDPNEMRICTECDYGGDFNLCACCITPLPQQQATAVPDMHAGLRPTITIKPRPEWSDWFDDRVDPSFNFTRQNNCDLDGFSNDYISDAYIIPEMFNFITGNMFVSYVNSHGVEDRRLRIEHCKRLSSRYLETNKIEITGDTMLNNRVKFTVQRSCDQIENKMLYGECVPQHTRNPRKISFWQAWWPELLGFLALILFGYMMLSSAMDEQITAKPSHAQAHSLYSTSSESVASKILIKKVHSTIAVPQYGKMHALSLPLDQVMARCVDVVVQATELQVYQPLAFRFSSAR